MAFKMKGFPFNEDYQKNRRIKRAKRITRRNVKNTTSDSPDFDESKFDKSEKRIQKADKLLQKAGYGIEEREGATGAAGYDTAMDWATEPMVTKKDKSPMKKRTYSEAKANDPKLDEYIKNRKNYKAGSTEYEDLQAKINAAYGTKRSEKIKASQVKRHKDDPSRTGDQKKEKKKNTNEYVPQTVSPRKEYDPASRNKRKEYDPSANRNKEQLRPSSKGNSKYLEKRNKYEYTPQSQR